MSALVNDSIENSGYMQSEDRILGEYIPGKLDGMVVGRVASFNFFVHKDDTVARLSDELVHLNDVYAVGVVDDDFHVEGIIIRRELFNLLGTPAEREIYSRRTVASVMRTAETFYILTNVMTVSDKIADDLKLPSMQYYLVTKEDNLFAGIFSSKDMLMYLSEITKKEIEKARKIQSGIIREERIEEHGNFNFAGASIMARGVGGDFYDFRKYNDENIFTTLCDVSGKGISASLISPLIGGMISVYDFSSGIRRLVTSLNDYVYRTFDAEIFITGLFANINVVTGEIMLIDSGHSYLYVHREGKLVRLSTRDDNIPLGITSEFQPRIFKYSLKKGDILVFLSDGITEQAVKGGDIYGEKRLGDLIGRNRDRGLKVIKDELINEVAVYRGHIPQQDDMTIILIEYK